MINKTKIKYIFAFFAVLVAEICIALFVRDDFVRPYVGDMLVTVLICLFFRGFFSLKTKLLPIFVFVFSAAVEIGQYFDFVKLIGLDDNRFISVLLGRTFSVADLICYAVGCIMFFIFEQISLKKSITPKKRVLLSLLIAVITLLITYITATTVNIITYSKTDEKQKADVAIVLGAATSNGNVSPVYEQRLNHAATLYNEGYANYIIVTGGYGEGSSVSDAFAAKEYLISCDIPEDIIYLEEESTITQENLLFSKQLMEDNSLKTAIIVSDPLHMKRAMLMAKDYEITAFSSPTPTTRYMSLKTKIPFLLREEFFYVGYRIYRLFFM